VCYHFKQKLKLLTGCQTPTESHWFTIRWVNKLFNMESLHCEYSGKMLYSWNWRCTCNSVETSWNLQTLNLTLQLFFPHCFFNCKAALKQFCRHPTFPSSSVTLWHIDSVSWTAANYIKYPKSRSFQLPQHQQNLNKPGFFHLVLLLCGWLFLSF